MQQGEALQRRLERATLFGCELWGGSRTQSNEVAERPNVAAYLASERRIAFNEHGIFRHYAELED